MMAKRGSGGSFQDLQVRMRFIGKEKNLSYKND